MSYPHHARLVCRISRGAFSGERVFRVPLPDGREHVGGAPVGYFRHPDGRRFGPGDGATAERAEGLVEVLVLGDRDGEALVRSGDGETFLVGAEWLQEGGPS